MAESLPEQITALQPQPPPRGPAEALALACHAALLQSGFVAVDAAGAPQPRLPPGWNDREPYCFHYRHEQSSLTYLVKMVTMGPKLMVLGTANEDPKAQVVPLELLPEDHVAALTHELCHPPALLQAVRRQLGERLVPNAPDPAAARESRPPAPQPQPRPPDADFRDPLRDWREGHPLGQPFGVGGGDLHPFGFGPGLGPGSGMLVGPNHPGFGLPGGPFGRGAPPGNRPPFPGARFDPFGPRGPSGDPDWDGAPPPGSSDMYL
eukprot:EG_transcript_21162